MFAVDGGDKAFFVAFAARKPAWRETGTSPAAIDHARDVAEPQVKRTKHQNVSAEHELIIEVEERFPDMSSAACRQVGCKFADTATHARTVSQRLSDRTQARSLAAERAEPPASADLVRRLFEWLRVQIEKLLDRLLPAVRKMPEVLPPVRRRPEILPPVRKIPEVLPPIGRQPVVLPPVRRQPEILPPVRKTPEVLPPVRTKPRVQTPQPDPLPLVIARIAKQHPNESSSTWLEVKNQLFEHPKTLAGQKAQAAANALFHRTFTREGFPVPLPPPAAPDRIEAIKASLRECAREECKRLGLAPQMPVDTSRQRNREPERSRGRDYTPGDR